MFLEKLFLKLLKFIPNYFNYKISKKWKNFHFLEWKKIKLPSINEKNEIRKAKVSERFSVTHDDVIQHHLYWLLEEKKDLLKYKKFINLLRFIERFKSNIKKLIYDQPFIGYINTVTGFDEFRGQFIENFKGKFLIKYPEINIIFLGGIIIRDSSFFSIFKINNFNFRLTSNMAQIFKPPLDIPTPKLVHGIFFSSYIDILRI